MSTKSILFLGDSFTWGEGLELYSNDPKWVAERSIDNSTWANSLSYKQDETSVLFRNKNRFPGIVSDYFNCDVFVDDENGGRIARNLLILEQNLIKNNITDVVLQFSTYTREAYHLSFDCRCDFCLEYQWPSLMDNLMSYVHKNRGDAPGDIKNVEKAVYDLVSSKINLYDYNTFEFLNQSEKFIVNLFVSQFAQIASSQFHRIQRDIGIKFHYIDSWCDVTSNGLQHNHKISPYMIYLIGKNGRRYRKWSDWLSTFEVKSIADDFPIAANHHPSLEMHQYLAKSVIAHLQKFDKTKI